MCYTSGMKTRTDEKETQMTQSTTVRALIKTGAVAPTPSTESWAAYSQGWKSAETNITLFAIVTVVEGVLAALVDKEGNSYTALL